MQKVLRSEGYYDARVEYRLESEEKPVRVTVEVATGARYVLKQFVVTYSGPGSSDPELPRDAHLLGATPGQPARAEVVADARRGSWRFSLTRGIHWQRSRINRRSSIMRMTACQ
jgi:outer membrane protein assembly factor BamA